MLVVILMVWLGKEGQEGDDDGCYDYCDSGSWKWKGKKGMVMAVVVIMMVVLYRARGCNDGYRKGRKREVVIAGQRRGLGLLCLLWP